MGPPDAIASGCRSAGVSVEFAVAFGFGTGNSVTAPDVVIVPISSACGWRNQRFPSGPFVIPLGSEPAGVTG